MTQEQKLAVLAEVGAKLLRREEAPPELTAVLEATVATIYCQLFIEIECELDFEEMLRDSESHENGFDPRRWRKLVLRASQQAEFGSEEAPLISIDCNDLSEWELLVQSLAERILWDDDWNLPDLFLDADPEISQAMKQCMGIDENYYVAIPPDPNEPELAQFRATLRNLTANT